MKVVLGKDSDIFTLNSQEDYFEWSYFETEWKDKKDNYSLVIIIFNGCPFLPEYYSKNIRPTINISLHKNDKLVSFSLSSYKNIEKRSNKLVIEDILELINTSDESKILHLRTQDIRNKDIEIKIKFSPRRKIKKQDLDFGKAEDGLIWGINAVSYNVSGSVKFDNELKKFNSLGYHDYNSGYISKLSEQVKYWYWAKSNDKEYNYTFFHIKYKDCFGSLFIKENGIFEVKKNITPKFKFSRTNMLLKYPKKLDLDGTIIQSKKSMDFHFPSRGIKFSGLGYSRRKSVLVEDDRKYSATLETFHPKTMQMALPRILIHYGLNHYGKKSR